MTHSKPFAALFVALLLAFPLASTGQPPAQNALFVHAGAVRISPGPGEVVLVDLNRDRHLDMVTRHLLQRRVSVLLGDGKGRFAPVPSSPIALDYQPGGVAIADLNGDAAPDLAVSASERDHVDVFLGDGQGGFTRANGSPFAASASTEFFTRMVRLADVNADGHLDMITANGRANTVSVLFGDGRARFTPGSTVKRAANGKRHAYGVGDFDGDTRVDLVIASRTSDDDPAPGRIALLRGDGKGGFVEASGTTFTVSQAPRSVTLADMNGDRRPDLVLSHGGGRLSVLLNDGRGTFTAAPGSPFDVPADAFGVVVADVNGDAKPDVLAAAGETAIVLLGDGRGGAAPAAGSPFPAGPGSYSLSVGDINEDGKPDVAMSSFEGDSVTVLLAR